MLQFETLLATPLATPQVIFLDAVGTLFGVKGSVGEMYLNVTRRFDVELDPTLLDQAFYASFKAAPPMAFPGIPLAEIPQHEYAWWKAVAEDTFTRAGVYQQFTDFSAFFTQLYTYFESAEPWMVYPDTFQFLNYWHQKSIPLGILSNFDSRIYPVLDALDLTHYFDSITISTEVRAAKPDPFIFQTALARYNCAPETVWHIGDSYKEDYLGATAAGIRAFWLKR
jgi:putative hydrolase of the HAD superfamily